MVPDDAVLPVDCAILEEFGFDIAARMLPMRCCRIGKDQAAVQWDRGLPSKRDIDSYVVRVLASG